MKQQLPKVPQDFQTQKQCIEYLEKLRWNGVPICPYCGSTNTVKLKNENRHHCNQIGCKRTFSVLIGTIFEECRFPLPKFFLLIKLMLDARKGVSSAQLSRNLEVSYKTAWCAMVETINDLQGIVEADESYLGGKPRKRNKPAYNVAYLANVDETENDEKKKEGEEKKEEKIKRGRGTKKVKVVGFVERDGRVITKILERLDAQTLLGMLRKYVKEESATVITDDYTGYRKFDAEVLHLIIKHSEKEYARGNIHTNTIEGFWSIIKNGLRGQYHVLSKKYLPFYLAEWSYKYNRRNSPKLQFHAFMRDAVMDQKCFNNYKPHDDPKQIVYARKDKPPKAELKAFKKANKQSGIKRRAKKAAKYAKLKKVAAAEKKPTQSKKVAKTNKTKQITKIKKERIRKKR
jgi:transposase-like protein